MHRMMLELILTWNQCQLVRQVTMKNIYLRSSSSLLREICSCLNPMWGKLGFASSRIRVKQGSIQLDFHNFTIQDKTYPSNHMLG